MAGGESIEMASVQNRHKEERKQGEVEEKGSSRKKRRSDMVKDKIPDFMRTDPTTVTNMYLHSLHFEDLSLPQQIVSALLAGCFITFGALLSIFLSTGIEETGIQKAFTSFGFIIGFASVIFSGAALFTEVNVIMPIFFIRDWRRNCVECMRFWGLVFVMNFLGALFLSVLIRGSDLITTDEEVNRLQKVIDKKLRHANYGTAGWFTVVLSGMLGNWLVGLAAYFAAKARTIPGKFIGVALPVSAFVTLGVQHSPANMGYLAIGLVEPQIKVSWTDAIFWNIIPAGIGNLLGAMVFVALPFYYIHSSAFMNKSKMITAHE